MGIGARALREEARLEESVRDPDKVGGGKAWTEWSTRGLVGKFQGGRDYFSDILTNKFRILEYLFPFLQTLEQ